MQDMFHDSELMAVFVPQVEPYISGMCFLPKSPLELGREPWSKDIDVIFGGTASEGQIGYYFISMEKELLEKLNEDNSLLLLPEMRDGLTVEEARKNGKKLHELYFDNGSDGMSNFIEVNFCYTKLQSISSSVSSF